MSATHDQHKMVKLTPANCRAVDGKARRKSKKFRIKVSRASVANEAIEIGIKHVKV